MQHPWRFVIYITHCISAEWPRRGTDVPRETLIPSTGQRLPLTGLGDLSSEPEEDKMAFLQRVRHAMTEFSTRQTYGACGPFCPDGNGAYAAVHPHPLPESSPVSCHIRRSSALRPRHAPQQPLRPVCPRQLLGHRLQRLAARLARCPPRPLSPRRSQANHPIRVALPQHGAGVTPMCVVHCSSRVGASLRWAAKRHHAEPTPSVCVLTVAACGPLGHAPRMQIFQWLQHGSGRIRPAI